MSNIESYPKVTERSPIATVYFFVFLPKATVYFLETLSYQLELNND